MNFIIAQIISILTTATAVLSMQFKGIKPILICQILSNLFCATTYILLGGYSGSIICLIAIAQCLVVFAYNAKKIKPHLWVILVFIALYVATSAILFQSFADVFSAMGAVIFAIGIVQKKASATRRWYVANPVCWILYDIFTMAYGNILTHGIIFISTLLAIIRLDFPEYKRALIGTKKAQLPDKEH